MILFCRIIWNLSVCLWIVSFYLNYTLWCFFRRGVFNLFVWSRWAILNLVYWYNNWLYLRQYNWFYLRQYNWLYLRQYNWFYLWQYNWLYLRNYNWLYLRNHNWLYLGVYNWFYLWQYNWLYLRNNNWCRCYFLCNLNWGLWNSHILHCVISWCILWCLWWQLGLIRNGLVLQLCRGVLTLLLFWLGWSIICYWTICIDLLLLIKLLINVVIIRLLLLSYNLSFNNFILRITRLVRTTRFSYYISFSICFLDFSCV